MSHKFVVGGVEYSVESKDDVRALKNEVRLALYNQLTGKSTKVFHTKEKGVEQTWAALNAVTPEAEAAETDPPEQQPESPQPAQPEKPQPATAAAAKAPRKVRGYSFRLPIKKGELHEPQAGKTKKSARRVLFELLQHPNGASFEECQKATGWTTEFFLARPHEDGSAKTREEAEAEAKKTCYEGIRLLNTYCGYGLWQDEQDRIYLYKTPQEKPARAA